MDEFTAKTRRKGTERREGWEAYDSVAGARLAISDEQTVRTKQITGRVRGKRWELRGDMIRGQDLLKSLLEAETPDPEAVGSAYAALCRLHQKMLETQVQAHNDMQALLTPEQRNEAEHQRRADRRFSREGRGYRRGITPR